MRRIRNFIQGGGVQVRRPENSLDNVCFSFHCFFRFRVVSAVSRFGPESFRPWVVSAGSFRPGLFRPYFRVGRFGLIWWVVSAQ